MLTRSAISRAAMWAALACLSMSACGDAATRQRKAGVKPTYDKTTGKLKELAFDSNGNSRFDTWTEMDGTRLVRSRIDLNEDGRIDRWEEYDAGGQLVKVGFSRRDNGKPDAWAFQAPDGTLQRVEVASADDETRTSRWEYYGTGSGSGALVSADEDTNGDGRPDRWETYEQGAITSVAFDENGNGQPDRRLTYTSGGVVVEHGIAARRPGSERRAGR